MRALWVSMVKKRVVDWVIGAFKTIDDAPGLTGKQACTFWPLGASSRHKEAVFGAFVQDFTPEQWGRQNCLTASAQSTKPKGSAWLSEAAPQHCVPPEQHDTALHNQQRREQVKKGYVQDWEDLQFVISEWEPGAVSTPDSLMPLFLAASRLAQLPGREACTVVMDRLISEAKKVLTSIDPGSLAMIMYACGKVGHRDLEFLDQIGQQVLQIGDLSVFESRHIALMVYSLGSLLHSAQREFSKVKGSKPVSFLCKDELLEALVQELLSPSRADGLAEQDLANSLHGLAQLEYGDKSMVGKLLEEAARPEHLTRFLEQELTTIIKAVGCLGLFGHATVTLLVHEACVQERLARYKAMELASMFYSFGRYRLEDRAPIAALAREVSRPDRMAAFEEYQLSNVIYALDQTRCTDSRIVVSLAREAARSDRLRNFENRHLANLIYSLGRLELEDCDVAEALVAEVLQSGRIARLDAKHLSLVVFGLAHLPVGNKASHARALCRQICRPRRLQQFTNEQMYNVVHSLLQMGFKAPRLLNGIMQRVSSQDSLVALHPNRLAMFVYMFARLHMQPSPALYDILYDVTRPQQLQLVSRRPLVLLAYGVGRLGVLIQQLAQRLGNELFKPERLASLSGREVGILVYSLGRMKHRRDDLLAALLHKLLDPGCLAGLSTQSLSNLLHGLGLLKYVPDDSVLRPLSLELAKEERICTYSCQEMANIVTAFGKLKFQHWVGWIDVVEPLVTEVVRPERLVQFNEHELSSLLQGLSWLRYYDGNAIAGLTEEVTRPDRILGLDGKGIATALYALGQMGTSPPGVVAKLLAEALKKPRLSSFQAVELSTLLYSLGKLRHPDAQAVEALAEEILQPGKFLSLTEQHLANILYGLVETHCLHKPLLAELLREISQDRRASMFLPIELLSILRSLDSLQNLMTDSEGEETGDTLDLLKAAVGPLSQEIIRPHKLSSTAARQLCQAVHHLVNLGHRHPKTVLTILRHLTSAEDGDMASRGGLSITDVANLVFSLGPVGQADTRALPALAYHASTLARAKVTKVELRKLPNTGFCHLMIGFSILGIDDASLLDILAAETVRAGRLSSLRTWALCRVVHAFATLKYEHSGVLKVLVSELLRSDRAEKLDCDHLLDVRNAVCKLNSLDRKSRCALDQRLRALKEV
eukprot:evm.model.scf_316.5 EVM.evm.TU.scf_316.5   scf_316:79471-83838(-)